MAELDPTVWSILAHIGTFLALLFRAILVLITWLLGFVIVVLKVLVKPLAFLSNILLTLFAPVIYLASFVFSWIQAVFAFFSSLEPLYTFIGTAAAVGIISGVVVGVSSSYISSYLDIQGSDKSEIRKTKHRRSDSLLTDSTTTDLDWQWLESSSSRRAPASGLLSQTILEEDDSEY